MLKVRIVGINNNFFTKYDLYNVDSEIMPNETNGHKRPYVIVLRLKYAGGRQDFAIPFRSNISGNCNKLDYFALPPRSETKPRNRHGLHFAKMLPIDKAYFVKYNYPTNNANATLTLNYIQKNFGRLVQEAQSYIDRFAKGNRPPLCVDIDKIYGAIKAGESF